MLQTAIAGEGRNQIRDDTVLPFYKGATYLTPA